MPKRAMGPTVIVIDLLTMAKTVAEALEGAAPVLVSQAQAAAQRERDRQAQYEAQRRREKAR